MKKVLGGNLSKIVLGPKKFKKCFKNILNFDFTEKIKNFAPAKSLNLFYKNYISLVKDFIALGFKYS